jgi:chromate transport protein ChrA
MRLKLIIGASLLAAVLGAGACIAILMAFFSSLKLASSPGVLVVSTFVLPTATIVFASVFVYRHTSRRRKLQAIMTVILSMILTITFFVIASIVTSKTSGDPPPPSSPIAVNS